MSQTVVKTDALYPANYIQIFIHHFDIKKKILHDKQGSPPDAALKIYGDPSTLCYNIAQI